ncbi:MAG: hypothetical protein A2W20_00665 [Candidatus Aminicenantes bacterium RBG_16_66_30]|nr:MAG: hypothetical protein A2W20_00665 [Candidatus Aminicenantes bacterium RBG_16_66_30]
MDVLITPEARRELEALRAFRPRPGTWGVLVGHRRGSRFIVEKLLAAGDPGTVPGEDLLERLDAVWPGRTIGLIAVRPGAAFKRAARGPAWYGKLVLELAGTARAPLVRPFVVEFERRFFLDPISFAPAVKEKARE